MAIISHIDIRPVQSTTFKGLVAYADITLDDEIKIRNIKVIKVYTEDRYFIQFPTDPALVRSSSNNIVHPISMTARRKYEDAVISAYLKSEGGTNS